MNRLADRLRSMQRVQPNQAMADDLRDAADLIERQAAIRTEVDELLNEHQPEWASEIMKQRGKEPIGCRMCFPHDGSWPCISRMTADAILRILDGDES